ncbi:MAG: mucoidy inhibitor MuiA family protein [Bacteroidetes bacterium]|nr:MAG: mucoidy inhibitor MuiA family protein [Bacteroidota bacterium]
MKKLLSIILLFVVGQSWAGEEIQLKSKIDRVTVYMQGAQVYRKASFQVKPGVSQLIIEGISPLIDPKSLQVQGSGRVVIIDSKYDRYYPKPENNQSGQLPLKIRKSIALLQDSLEELDFELKQLHDEITIIKETANILKSNGAIQGKGKVNDSIPLLKDAVSYYAEKMNELTRKGNLLRRKKSKKEKLREGMRQRLTDLQNYQQSQFPKKDKGPIHRLLITVSSKEYVTGKMEVSYLVSKAGWTPLYDLKSSAQDGKVHLTYKAQVYQNTGIDWDDVRLAVSTNNPYRNKTKPSLHPWYVDYQSIYMNDLRNGQPAMEGGLKPKRMEEDDREENLEVLNVRPKGVDMTQATEFVQMVDQIIAAEFKIDLPYTIQSNNTKHMVLVKQEELDAKYRYFTVPKIDPSVYLVAQITKLDELKLVPAKANIFFEGSYMGETYIDPTQMEDTLSLSLGKDPNILVKRSLIAKDSKDRVIGSQRERTNAFEIEIRSMKSSTIELVVQDQIPVTLNKDINIEVLNKGKAKLNKQAGILQWELKLKAREHEKLNFGYKVKFDKNQQVALR